MEKLGQLRAQADADGTWDLIVVDTPPSRSALDFLDAPKRLGSFLDGRFIRLLSGPAKAGGRAYVRVFAVGVTLASTTMSRLLGGQMLHDVQTFVAALDTMFGGFRERAEVTYALLKDPATAFVVVASPERDALREATYFVDRLGQDGMPLAGVVANRVQTLAASTLTGSRAAAAADTLAELASGPAGGEQAAYRSDTAELTVALLDLHTDLAATARRHAAAVERFRAAHPSVAVVEVPAAATDIHDLDGLRSVGAALHGR